MIDKSFEQLDLLPCTMIPSIKNTTSWDASGGTLPNNCMVWAFGDKFLIADSNLVFHKIIMILSNVGVPEINKSTHTVYLLFS